MGMFRLRKRGCVCVSSRVVSLAEHHHKTPSCLADNMVADVPDVKSWPSFNREIGNESTLWLMVSFCFSSYFFKTFFFFWKICPALNTVGINGIQSMRTYNAVWYMMHRMKEDLYVLSLGKANDLVLTLYTLVKQETSSHLNPIFKKVSSGKICSIKIILIRPKNNPHITYAVRAESISIPRTRTPRGCYGKPILASILLAIPRKHHALLIMQYCWWSVDTVASTKRVYKSRRSWAQSARSPVRLPWGFWRRNPRSCSFLVTFRRSVTQLLS